MGPISIVAKEVLCSSRRNAPRSAGTAIANENSKAEPKERPNKIPAETDMPEREIPGTSAMDWAIPINNACHQRGIFPFFSFLEPAMSKTIPVNTNDGITRAGELKKDSRVSLKTRPTMPAGIDAMIMRPRSFGLRYLSSLLLK